MFAGKKGKRAEWTGRDWNDSFGDGLGRSWEDGRAYNFISAGGDPWYSEPCERSLSVHASTHIPQTGYVAVGITLDEASRFDEARVQVDGQLTHLAGLRLRGPTAMVPKASL